MFSIALVTVKTTQSDGDLRLIHTDKVDAEEVHQLRNNVTHLADHVVRAFFNMAVVRLQINDFFSYLVTVDTRLSSPSQISAFQKQNLI